MTTIRSTEADQRDESQWTNSRLGDMVEAYAGGTPPRGGRGLFGGEIPWVKSSELNQRRILVTEETLTLEGFQSCAAKWIDPGTPLIALYGATAGVVGWLAIRACTNQAVLALVPRDKNVEPRWIYWTVRHRSQQLIGSVQGSGQPNLNKGIVEGLTLRKPSPDEQSRIALVLDTVDEAIAKTEAVIAKLRQVRAGLLHDLLTRGLDKNGQLRDPIAHPEQFQPSPLGQIPAGWSVQTLEQITDPQAPICYGIVQVFDFVPNGVLVLAIRDLLGDYATGLHRTALSIDANYARSRVRPGDVLVSIKGTIGRIGLVPPHYIGNISRDLARVRPLERISSAFLVHLLRSPLGQKTLELAQVGTTRAELSIAPLKRIPFAFPQRAEQDQIATMLDTEDGLIVAHELELAKLVQLKSGLMTDLLTGRVRVPATLQKA